MTRAPDDPFGCVRTRLPKGACRYEDALCPCSTELVVFTPIVAGLSTCSDLCANSSALTMMSEQVQAALNAMLHAAGILHNDIKPENFFFEAQLV